MPGTLFVVATPIGNLEDITLRALRVLREADVVAAEDTRRTAGLLAHHAIRTPTISFHEHNARSRLPQLIARLQAGESVALVTDAGTPGISDPGVELVNACVIQGIAVDPIPGASALLVAALGSGFPLVPLTFLGFVPGRSNDRLSWLRELSAIPHTVVFYESPHRIEVLLSSAADILVDRPIVVARELTKLHQEFIRGTAATVLSQLSTVKGEFTLVVGPADKSMGIERLPASDAEIYAEFGRMTEQARLTRRQAVAAVARRFGRAPRDVYAAIERAKE